jgi:hypothetical protein
MFEVSRLNRWILKLQQNIKYLNTHPPAARQTSFAAVGKVTEAKQAAVAIPVASRTALPAARTALPVAARAAPQAAEGAAPPGNRQASSSCNTNSSNSSTISSNNSKKSSSCNLAAA